MKAVDLFAGCGGMSLGFQNAGFEIVAAFDKSKAALDIYRANFGHLALDVDLADVESASSWIRKFEPDIIFGGPPCQDFSSAGMRVLGERADLTLSFADIVRAVKPRWFVMENVPRIAESEIWRRAMTRFLWAGYSVVSDVLDASLCGVPQKRKRFFAIGYLGNIPAQTVRAIAENRAPHPMTVREYLPDIGIDCYYRHPRSYQRRGVFSVDEPSPTIRGVNRPVPKTYKKHPGDVGPAAGDNLRSLTPMERAAIQTFPPDFRWPAKNNGDLERAIGNAVPPKLAEYVARAILEGERQQ